MGYAVELLQPDRVKLARKAVEGHYNFQRKRYGQAFAEMGLKIYTGTGGFYHWCELPEGCDANEFNERLFKVGAAILKGSDCDMARPHSKEKGYQTPYTRFFRFSFGPLLPETFESDIALFRSVYEKYVAEVQSRNSEA